MPESKRVGAWPDRMWEMWLMAQAFSDLAASSWRQGKDDQPAGQGHLSEKPHASSQDVMSGGRSLAGLWPFVADSLELECVTCRMPHAMIAASWMQG